MTPEQFLTIMTMIAGPYLLFVSWVFDVSNLTVFVMFKFTPFILGVYFTGLAAQRIGVF